MSWRLQRAGGALLSSTWGLEELRWGRGPTGVQGGVEKALNPAGSWGGIIPAVGAGDGVLWGASHAQQKAKGFLGCPGGAPAGDGLLLVQMEVGRDAGNTWGDEPAGESTARSAEAAACVVISLCINEGKAPGAFLLSQPQQGKLPLEKWGGGLPWLLSPWDLLVSPQLRLCQCPAHSSAGAAGTWKEGSSQPCVPASITLSWLETRPAREEDAG